jgi:hypothetical protein
MDNKLLKSAQKQLDDTLLRLAKKMLNLAKTSPEFLHDEVPTDWGWVEHDLAKAAPKAIKSRVQNWHERTLQQEGKSTKTDPGEGIAIIHWNKHGGNFSVIAKKHAVAGANIDSSIPRSENHIFPHHIEIDGPYKIISHESGLHGDMGNPKTAIAVKMKHLKMFSKDQMPSLEGKTSAGLNIMGGHLTVGGKPKVEGHGLTLSSHRAPDESQKTASGSERKVEKRFPKIHVHETATHENSEQGEKLAASEADEVEKRCWEGYEPTPGKKPYSKGSCQPKRKSKPGLSVEKSEPLNKWMSTGIPKHSLHDFWHRLNRDDIQFTWGTGAEADDWRTAQSDKARFLESQKLAEMHGPDHVKMLNDFRNYHVGRITGKAVAKPQMPNKE